MAYPTENALFQWEEGERRLRETPDLEQADLESATWAVLDELRRRLGSSFTLEELADLYGSGTDWAAAIARDRRAGSDASWVVGAAFARYAREASDFGGGRRR